MGACSAKSKLSKATLSSIHTCFPPEVGIPENDRSTMAACGECVYAATCGLARALLPQNLRAACEDIEEVETLVKKLESKVFVCTTSWKVWLPQMSDLVLSVSPLVCRQRHLSAAQHVSRVRSCKQHSDHTCVVLHHRWPPENLDLVTPTKAGSGNTPHIPGEHAGFEYF